MLNHLSNLVLMFEERMVPLRELGSYENFLSFVIIVVLFGHMDTDCDDQILYLLHRKLKSEKELLEP